MFTLDSVVPKYPLSCITRNNRDLAICSPSGIYVLEDYGKKSLKRRFWPLSSIEFRAIRFLAPNSVELLALTTDGKSLCIFDSLTGALKPFWRDDTLKITSITVLDSGLIIFGTFDGGLFKIEGSESRLVSRINDPILFIVDEDSFVDSSGRLFWKSKIVLDDGVLQPCGLFHSKSSSVLLLIKHRTIYAFDTTTTALKTAKLEGEGVFCAATLLNDKTLFVSTDSGHHYSFDPTDGSLKRISTEESDSEDEQAKSDLESDLEIAAINPVKSERIFSVIQNHNDVLALKVDSIHKHAFIETFKISSNNTETPVTSTRTPAAFESVQIICPLCLDSLPQSLTLNTSQCLNGHPLTICSIKKDLVSKLDAFRCRDCNVAFSTNPNTPCKYCNGILTK